MFSPLLLAAAASPPLEGVVAQTISVTPSASGAVGIQGTKAAAIPVTASGEGGVTVTGSKAATIPVTATAAGSVPALGVANQTILVSQSAGTSLAVQGEATQTILVSQSGSGEIEVVKATVLQNARILRENLTWHAFGNPSEIENLAEKYFFGYTFGVGETSQLIVVVGEGVGQVSLSGAASQAIPVGLSAAGGTGGVQPGDSGSGAGQSLVSDRASRLAITPAHVFGLRDPSLATLGQDYFFGSQEGVSGAVAQAISVTQNAAGDVATPLTGTLSQQIVIRQDARSGALFAAGPNTKLILLGDSIFQLGENHFIGSGPNGTANHFSRQGNGEIQWAFMRRPGFRYANWGDLNALNPHGAVNPLFRGANFALGSTWATYFRYMRMTAPLNSGASIAVVNLGTNFGVAVPPYTTVGDSDAGHVIQMLSDIRDMLLERGIVVVLGTIRARTITNPAITSASTVSPERRAYIDTVNAWARTQHNPPNVWVWDNDPDLLDPNPTSNTNGSPWLEGSAYPWALYDNVHLTTRGAFASGYHSLGDIIAEIVGPGTWFDDDPFTGNLITNGGLVGSTSSAVTGPEITGVGPTGWSATNSGTTNIVTAAASLEANADSGGQNWVFDVSSTGAGTNNFEVIVVRPPAMSVASLGLQPTDYVQFWLEVEAEDNPDGVLVRLGYEVQTNTIGPWGGLSNLNYRALGEHRGRLDNGSWPLDAFSGWVESEPILVGSNTTLTPRIYIEARNDIASSVRVKIKRFIARTVEDPHITFPFEFRGDTVQPIQIGQSSSGAIGAASNVSGSLSKTIPVLQSASALVPAAQGRGRFPLHSSRYGRETLVKNHVFGNQGTAAAQVTGDHFFGYQKPKGVLRKTLSIGLAAAGLASRIGMAAQTIQVTQSAASEAGGGTNALIDFTGAFLTDHTGAFLEPFLLITGQADQDILVTGSGTGEAAGTEDGGLVDSTGAFLADAAGDFLVAEQTSLGEASQVISVTQSATGLLPVSGELAKTIPVTHASSGELGTVDGQLFDAAGAFLTDSTGSPLAEVLGIMGASDQVISVTQTAAGGVQNVIHGDHAGAIPVGQSASSSVSVSGEASQFILVEQIGSQTVTVAGRATQRIDVTQTGEAVAPVLGSANQPITVTQSADGLVPVLGQASQPIQIVQSADGLAVFYQGEASQPIQVVQAASGLTVFYQGAASQPILVGQSASGLIPVAGAANQQIPVSQSADGGVLTAVAANQPIAVTQSAVGGVTDFTGPTVISGIAGLLNAVAGVYRNSPISDGRGGWIENLVLVGTVQCRVSSPSGKDQRIAEQRQASVTHAIYMPSDADIQLGDMLQIGGLWHYVAIPDLRPSVREHHLKILTEERQKRAA